LISSRVPGRIHVVPLEVTAVMRWMRLLILLD